MNTPRKNTRTHTEIFFYILIPIIIISNFNILQIYAIQKIRVEDEISSYEIEAQQKILEAFKKISLAEKKGANLSVLANLLDIATDSYYKGKNMIEYDPDKSILNFKRSIAIANLTYNADIIINYELDKKYNADYNIIIQASVSSFLIVITSFIFWKVIKKYSTKLELVKKVELN